MSMQAQDRLKVELGRRYRFAASHRLHSGRLSEEENSRLYGKCNNPHGHGHNYVLEVSLSGEIDPTTGMIANLGDLDAFVENEVLQAFDHRSLNEEVPVFRQQVPTTENLCMEIYRRLRAFPKAKLERAMAQLFEADRDLRDARPDDRIVMEEMILALTAA